MSSLVVPSATPRKAEKTYFRANMMMNPLTGGFLTAEGLHFFSLFHKRPDTSHNYRVVSRGLHLPAVISGAATAEILSKLLYWETANGKESYSWVPLPPKFLKPGMDPKAGAIGIEVNEECRHLFETEGAEEEQVEIVAEAEEEVTAEEVEEEEAKVEVIADKMESLPASTTVAIDDLIHQLKNLD